MKVLLNVTAACPARTACRSRTAPGFHQPAAVGAAQIVPQNRSIAAVVTIYDEAAWATD
ncbi:hypothetical protein ACFPOI_51475 [Nonomuraea angiospora]|uniref:Uncharacterized protein n=1 Tax=Nonomuraea angiospora TaxID=46172 RepID=A0ABR9LRP1_9ACTN|nr:hypothetical protein [Nonomuraea angiospora]MBE1583328.1 hypothetical protein [Nonomuraea angiospora]